MYANCICLIFSALGGLGWDPRPGSTRGEPGEDPRDWTGDSKIMNDEGRTPQEMNGSEAVQCVSFPSRFNKLVGW